MQIEAFQYLLTISKTHSLNKASNLLNVPYQSINYALQNLETEFQTQLLTRTRSGTFLTESGELVKEFSEKFLDDLENLKATLTKNELDSKLKKNDTLSICSAIILHNTIFPDLISKFEKKYPNLRIFSYGENSIVKVIESIKNGEIDAAITFANKGVLSTLKGSEDIQYKILGKTNLFAICSPSHPLSQKDLITLKECLTYPISLYKSTPALTELELMLSNYSTITYGQITDNLTIYLNSLQLRKLVGLTCSFQYLKKEIILLAKESTALKLIPIEDAPLTYSCVLMPKDLSPRKKELLHCLFSLINEL